MRGPMTEKEGSLIFFMCEGADLAMGGMWQLRPSLLLSLVLIEDAVSEILGTVPSNIFHT